MLSRLLAALLILSPVPALAQGVYPYQFEATDTPSDNEVPTYDNATGKFTWEADANAGGDVTDVFNCSSGDCADVVVGATDSLDFSAIDGNAASEGLVLPQTTSCGGSGIATGAICYGTTSDELCVWDGAAWDCQTLGAAASGDVTDVFDCASGNCADIVVGATDSLDFSAIDGNAAGEGLILPQTTSCGGSGQTAGAICYGTTSDELCVWDGAAWDCQTLGAAGSGDITDVFDCNTGDCTDIAAGATDSLTFAAVDASATGEGLVLPQTATCGGTGYGAGAVCYDTGTDSLCVGDGAAWDCQTLGVTQTTDTNANTICAGTTTYLDGEGNCDDISSVYLGIGATAANSSGLEGTDLGTLSDTKWCVYDLAGTEIDCNVDPVVDTNTNAATICAGTTTYLDGEGNCDDISSVYAAASHSHTGSDLSGIDISDDTNLAAGAGLSLTGDTLATASTEQSFLLDVTALACGASTKGQMAVLDGGTTLQYCDDAGTPAQHYVAVGSSTGVATSATALAANGGNCTAGNYPLGVDASGAVEDCTAITGDISDVFNCASGDCADIAAGATDSLSFAAIDASATGEGLIVPQTATCGGTGYDAGAVCYDTGTDSFCVGDGAAWDCQVLGVTDTNTNAATICAGTTTYLDGEGNCDDISSVYQAASAVLTSLAADGADFGTLTDTKYCTYDSANTEIDCDSTPGGTGDITDVFSCASGDCASITMAATDLLNMSGTDASTTTEGLILPQHATACAGGTAEGQVCWEADANILHMGDGATLVDFVPTSAFSGDATVSTTGAVTVADDQHAHTTSSLSGIDIGDDTNLAAGAGLALTGDSLATASSEADFLANGALTCGASTQGKMQVHTTPLQYCDNAGTPTLQYAAYGNSAGAATSVADDVVAAADMADGDHGDFSYATNVATLDADVVAAAEMADADHGDVSWSGGVAAVDSGAVAMTELSSSCTDAQVAGGNAGGTALECQTDDDIPDDATDLAAIDSESELIAVADGADANFDNIFADNEAAGGFDLDNSQTECLTFMASGIVCDSSGGCTDPADVDATIGSYRSAAFANDADDIGYFTFKTPLNMTGTTAAVRYAWIVNDASCDNGATDDVCWEIDGGSFADDAAFYGGSLGGTAVGVTDRCTANGDVMITSAATFTHGMSPDQLAMVSINRDVDESGSCGADEDDLGVAANLLWVEFCYEVDNLNSGEN